MSSAVIADGRAVGFVNFQGIQLHQKRLNRHIRQVGIFLNYRVQFINIALMVLGVMELHRPRINMGLQIII